MFDRRKIIAVTISVLAAIALGVSAYLTWVIWQSGAVAGCTGEAVLDCDDVLTSRWSKWFGLPVSLLGGLTYLGILGVCWPAARRPQGLAMTGLFALTLLAMGAAVWFIGLQAIQLQSYCLYCLTIHCCGLVIGVLSLLLVLDQSATTDYGQMRSLLGVAAEAEEDEDELEPGGGLNGVRLLTALSISAVGLVILMGGQLLSEPTETMAMQEVDLKPMDIEPAEQVVTKPALPEDGKFAIATDQPTDDDDDWLDERIDSSEKFEAIIDNSVTGQGPPSFEEDTVGSLFGAGSSRVFQALAEPVDLKAMPMLGNPDAPHVMVEMMDYTCKHCRHLHPHLHAALERYGDQLGVVIHHVPLSKKCSPYVRKDHPGKKYACEYSQLAIGVWELAPDKFPEFHEWLLESDKPPLVSKARRRAMGLVGDAILLDKQLKANISKRLVDQSKAFKQLNSGLPILLFTNGALRGVPDESKKLFEYLETTLGVEPR